MTDQTKVEGPVKGQVEVQESDPKAIIAAARQGLERRARAGELDEVRPAPRRSRLRGEVQLLAWSRPGAIDERSRDAIYGTLEDLCHATFGVSFCDYWKRRRGEGYLESLSHLSVLVTDSGQIIAFTSYQMRDFGGRRALFIDSTAELPEFHGHRLMSPLFSSNFLRERLKAPHRRMFMVVRTENPIVHAALTRLLHPDNMYPAPGKAVPEEIQQLGRDVAEWLGQGDIFSAPELKLVNAYPDLGSMYLKPPKSGIGVLDDFYAEHLTAYDAFLLIAPVHWRYLVPFAVTHRPDSLRLRR